MFLMVLWLFLVEGAGEQQHNYEQHHYKHYKQQQQHHHHHHLLNTKRTSPPPNRHSHRHLQSSRGTPPTLSQHFPNQAVDCHGADSLARSLALAVAARHPEDRARRVFLLAATLGAGVVEQRTKGLSGLSCPLGGLLALSPSAQLANRPPSHSSPPSQHSRCHHHLHCRNNTTGMARVPLFRSPVPWPCFIPTEEERGRRESQPTRDALVTT